MSRVLELLSRREPIDLAKELERKNPYPILVCLNLINLLQLLPLEGSLTVDPNAKLLEGTMGSKRK